MFCLFSTLGPSLHTFRGRSLIYTGSPRVGKAPSETTSHGRQQPPLVNLIKREWLQRAGLCSSKPSWSSRTEAVSLSRILQSRICFSSRLLCLGETLALWHFLSSGFSPPNFPLLEFNFPGLGFQCKLTLCILHCPTLPVLHITAEESPDKNNMRKLK